MSPEDLIRLDQILWTYLTNKSLHVCACIPHLSATEVAQLVEHYRQVAS